MSGELCALTVPLLCPDPSCSCFYSMKAVPGLLCLTGTHTGKAPLPALVKVWGAHSKSALLVGKWQLEKQCRWQVEWVEKGRGRDKERDKRKKTGFISVRCHKSRQKDEVLLLLLPLTIPQSRGCHQEPLCEEERGEGEGAMRNLVGGGQGCCWTSHNTQDNPHHREWSSPNCQQCRGREKPCSRPKGCPH